MLRSSQAPDENSLEQSCLLCGQPDSSQMVSCDECRRWYHFACVGVTEAIADYDWCCQRCQDARFSCPVTTTPIASTSRRILPLPVSEMLPAVSSVYHSTTGEAIPSYAAPVSGVTTNQGFLQSSSANSMYDPTRTYTSFVSFPVVDPLMTTAPSTVASGSGAQSVHVPFSTVPVARNNLVSQLPTELKLRFLEEEQALEMKHLLQRYQLLMDETPAPAANNISSGPNLGNAASLAAQCHLFSAHQPRMTSVGLPPAPVLPNPQCHSFPVLNDEYSHRRTRGNPCFPSPVQNRPNQDCNMNYRQPPL